MKLNEALYGAKRSAIREFSELAGRTPGCVALTLGEPDFATPQPICSAVTDALTTGQTHYIDNNGTRVLREAVGIPDYTAYKGHPSELTEQSNWLYIQFAKPKGCP